MAEKLTPNIAALSTPPSAVTDQAQEKRNTYEHAIEMADAREVLNSAVVPPAPAESGDAAIAPAQPTAPTREEIAALMADDALALRHEIEKGFRPPAETFGECLDAATQNVLDRFALISGQGDQQSSDRRCFECGGELQAPICPGCNPELAIPVAGSGVEETSRRPDEEQLTDVEAFGAMMKRARYPDPVPGLVETVEIARRTFVDYAAGHRSKGTDEGNEKAQRNERLADTCAQALAAWRNRGGRVNGAP